MDREPSTLDQPCLTGRYGYGSRRSRKSSRGPIVPGTGDQWCTTRSPASTKELGTRSCLVIVGVRAEGTKELVTIADGYRESTESWADLLRDAKLRGCGPRWSWSATGHSACGRRCATVPRDPGAALLGARRRQRPQRPAHLGPAGRPPGPGPGPRRRGPGPRRGRDRCLCHRARGQVAQGGGQDHRQARRPAVLLRLPGRALDPPEDDQSHMG